MKLTNSMNLPSAFENMAQSNYQHTPKRYSATTLIKPAKEIILSRRHYDEITLDVADMIWLLFGLAVHYILEKHDESGYAEMKLTHTLENGYTISGKLDLYSKELARNIDYKTASVTKVNKGDWEDWKLQADICSWLCRKNGMDCKESVYYAILKDHTKKKYKEEVKKFNAGEIKKVNYPQHPVYKKKFSFSDTDYGRMEKWIADKIDLIIKNEQLPDDQLTPCTPGERWETTECWKVYKTANEERCMKGGICDTEEKAKEYMAKYKGHHIKHFPKVSNRCEYCLVNQFCNFYKGE